MKPITVLLLVIYSSPMMAREDLGPMLDQLCKEMWPRDQTMQSHCKTQQIAAFHRIQAKSQQVDLQRLQECARHWNINFVQVDACIDRRNSSPAPDSQQNTPQLPQKISSSILIQCKNVWGNDQRMLNKCYEQQVTNYGNFQ